MADCLQARGDWSTLNQVLSSISSRAQTKFRTDERREIIAVSNLESMSSTGGPSPSAIRAAMLVLIQHSLVKIKKSTIRVSSKPKTVYYYQFLPDRARILPRYPRFLEYTRKVLDETAAAVVEELLVQGRLRTVELIVYTVEHLQKSNSSPVSDKYTNRQTVLECFRRLVTSGFIEQVDPIETEYDDDQAEGDIVEILQPAAKKRRVDHDLHPDDPAVETLLQNGNYKMFSKDSVWRVNVDFFNCHLRSLSLGYMVFEKYGHKAQSCGPMITAALKAVAHKKYCSKIVGYEENIFTAEDVKKHLPKPVIQNLEKRPGDVATTIYKTLMEVTTFRDPPVLSLMEDGGGNKEGTKFCVLTSRLLSYLQERIVHQVVFDSHGEAAARICSILRKSGYMESDTIAEASMTPAKDTREVLHRLYRANLISLFNINQGKQHNPASMIYCWTVEPHRIKSTITDQVCNAFLNIRLRRQHEEEIGSQWIERAKDAGVTDENENEADRENYEKFCKGLERLDNAALQLDETLMALVDFNK